MPKSKVSAEAPTLPLPESPATTLSESRLAATRPWVKVFMMDLWSIVPYYDAYLCQALKAERVSVTLGAITYYLDPSCFVARGVRNRPGAVDLAGKFKPPPLVRQALKFLENGINTAALMIRFGFSPPDIVHVQYLPMLQLHLPFELWFLRYCRRLGSKLVCTVHDILPSDTGEAYKHTFQKLYGMMDALICHSEAAKQELISGFHLAPECIRVIPHGPFFYDFPKSSPASARNRLGVKEEECLVLWQGIIRPYKGVQFLLDAWARVQQAGARARLLIAGIGDEALLAAIRRKVQALSLEDSVDLRLDFAEPYEMLSYYQAADIVVYPYRAVTTSGALMTGITQGKAIIATSLAPFRELLQDGKNALLCRYADTPGLAAALLVLINDSPLRARLAAASASLNLGEQMWKQIAAQTVACYESLRG
jgi:glycosyltransferase involved in cell wall biosynthesis